MAEMKDCDIIFKLRCLVGEKDKTIKQLREENAELKKYINQLDEEQKSIDEFADAVQEEYKREIAELKRLLRLAVEEITKHKLYADLGMMSRGALCKSCKTRSITNRVCQVCNYEYEYAEEALKLIGDDK